MAPFKSSLARSAGKLLGVFRETDLSLRGATQSTRKVEVPQQATGGTIVGPYGGKTIHMFKSSGTFTSFGDKTCEYVIVAGGAAGSSSGGGGTAGGGGGAGGYLTGTGLVLNGAFRVEVGDGGTCPAGGSGGNGNPSYIGPAPGWTGNSVANSKGTHAVGGGRGGCYSPDTDAGNGGSGGGGDYNSIPAGFGFNPSTPSPVKSGEPRYRDGDTQGYPGGDGATGDGQIGGGGGGAGSAGQGGGPNFVGGNGVRIPTTFHTPNVNIGAPGPAGSWYCGGGGGGGRYDPGAGGTAGYGGGGNGRSGNSAYAGTANSGGGGGGVARADSSSGGSGGSGFVLIAYDEIT